MSNVSNQIKEAQERAEQLRRQRIREENRESARQRKIDTRRKIVIGAIMIKHFPDIINFEPKLRQADTNLEFFELEEFISTVAIDPNFANLFQKIIDKKFSAESHHEQ